jgi:hypothetical protein
MALSLVNIIYSFSSFFADECINSFAHEVLVDILSIVHDRSSPNDILLMALCVNSFFYLTSIDVEECSCMDNLPEYLCSSLVAFINCDIDLNNDEELTFNWCSTVLCSLL